MDALPEVDKARIKSGIEILDIACGCCSYWYDLYRSIYFKSIDGIDLNGVCSFPIAEDLPFSEKYVDAGSYKHYLGECKYISKIEPEISEQEFELIFHRNSNTINAFDYIDKLISQRKKYSFIILSCFIHLLDVPLQPKIDLLKKLPKIVDDGGFIYLFGNNPLNEEEEKLRLSDKQIAECLLPLKPVVRQYPGSNLYSLIFM